MLLKTVRKLTLLSIVVAFSLMVMGHAADAGSDRNAGMGGAVVVRSIIEATVIPQGNEADLQAHGSAPQAVEETPRVAEAAPQTAEAVSQTAEAGAKAGEADAQSSGADAESSEKDAQAKEKDAEADKEKAKAAHDEDITVFVKKFTFTGNTVIDTRTLEKAVEEFQNQDLTLDDIRAATEAATLVYQEKGYVLAKAYAQAQEIRDGVLNITLVEGQVGKINVTGNTYYHERVLKRNFLPQLRHGVINESMLEKALLLSKEVPDTETRIVLKKGEKPGTADMVLNVEDEIPVKWSFDFNNFGSRFVAEERWGTRFQITDPWWGSTLDLRGTSGSQKKDTAMGVVKLAVPLTSYGTKALFKYLKSDYLVGAELADLGIEGESIIWGAKVFHPILKTATFGLGVTVGYERKYAEGFVDGVMSTRDKLDVFSIKVDVDNLDRFLGKTIAAITYSHGAVLIPAEWRKVTISRQFHDPDFDLARLDVLRIQKIYGYTNIMLRFSGQLCGDRLVSLEQSLLGGYGTVRGHRPAAFLGDSGYIFSTELMFAPPFISDKTVPWLNQRVGQMVQFAVFFDNGGVYTTDTEADEFGNEFLSGWGGGLRLYYKEKFRFKFDVGWPIHDRETKVLDDKNAYYYFLVDYSIF